MEEDLKVLEELTKGFDNLISYRQKQAIENLINRNKELEEHSGDLLSQNEMFKDMYDEEVYKNKALEKENKKLKGFTGSIFNDTLEKDYISKSKVKEKIEFLEDLLDLIKDDTTIARYKREMLEEHIKDFQDLLQEGDDK